MSEDFTIRKLGNKNTENSSRGNSPFDTIKKLTGKQTGRKDKPDDTHMPRRKKRKIKKPLKYALTALGALAAIVFVLGIAIAIPGRNVARDAQDVARVGEELAFVMQNQDLEQSKEKIEQIQSELEELKNSYQSLSWTKVVPFVGGYYRDGEHGIAAASEFLVAGDIAVTEITPYADLLGLEDGDNAFVDQPADERIETAILTFEKVTPKLGEIAEHLDAGREELDQIKASRYPNSFRGKEIRPQIEKAQELADQMISVFVDAQPLLEILPDMLGVNEERRYLLLFQNDKELRPTGGFITAYATLVFDKGKMRVENSSNIYDLDERQVRNIQAPEEILNYHKGVYYANLRDINLSPDFYESMLMFEDLLENVSNPPEYDGIIALDTEVLVKTIEVLDGSVFIPEYGENFTIEPDDRCDGCPMVIYELSDYAGRRVGYVREDRKGIIGDLMFALMQKSLGVSPSVYWGPLTQTLFEQINQKHILFYMHDDEIQQAFENLNFAGRIKEFDGDYLHINDTNFAGAKSNLFVQHFITQDIEIENDGSVTKTITIDYKNPSAPSDCNLEREGLCLNGLLRNWLRVYVPEGSELISFEGSETEVVTKEELGKTVFEGFLTIAPRGSSQVVIVYELPFTVQNEYDLLIQKQPGTFGHEHVVTLNGREKETFKLITDKQVRYEL